jgi:dihydropteroate synthase
MGILNVTPDSFSDGGRYFEAEKALQRGMEMMKGGADIIDVGGESTRPGAEPVSITEELDRVLPVIEGLVSQGIPVSIDTYKAEVARQAVEAGAVAINDISGMHFEPEIADITARNRTLLILMHIQGTPRDMQKNPQYRDLIGEMLDYLDEGVNCATEAGVERKKIIIDPGIGFGKNLEHNLEILRRLREFKVLGLPILVGVSRKSFIGAILNKPVEERLYGTCSACALAIANGADILRVHDPEQIRQVAQIADGITGKFPSSDAG